MPAPSSSPARRFRLPGAITVAVRSPTPARPVNVSRRAPRERANSTHSRQIVGGGDPRRVQAVRLRRGGCERRGVLRHARHLDPGDVRHCARRPAPRGRRPRRAGSAGRRRWSRGPGRPCRRPPRGRAQDRRATRSRASGSAPPTYSLGSWPSGLDEALGKQQDSGPGADPVAEPADDRGQRGRRDGEADEVARRRARCRRRA